MTALFRLRRPGATLALLGALFLQSLALVGSAHGATKAPDPRAAIRAEIARRHDEGVKRLQEWVRQPSIAAENRGMSEGCDLMMRLARDAGFDSVTRVPTNGQPGVFATLDAKAPRTIGLYF